MSLHAFIDEMGATFCGFHAEEGMEHLEPDQIRQLEVDLGVMILEEDILVHSGLAPVAVQLLELAAGIYCERCGRHLRGADHSKVREGRG